MNTRTTAAAIAITAAPALAVTNGFGEDFNGGLNGWASGGGLGGTNSSISTPGFDGAGDNFLLVDSLASPSSQLATRVIGDPDFSGDYIAAGITDITFALLDPGTDENAIIRVGIGIRQQNFWISNRNWDPNDTWQTFAVDLTNPAEWTQVIGQGDATNTFEAALSNADVLQFRAAADAAGKAPDAIAADLGVDDVAFIPTPASAAALGLAGLAAVRRRR